MTVHWAIQRTRSNPIEANHLYEIVATLGRVAHLIDLTPFSSTIPPVPEIPAGAPVVCLGPGFVPRALDHPTWRPGIFFDDASFRWSSLAARWSDLMLNRRAKISTVGDVREQLDQGGRLFVRPDADNKAFDSGVHDAESFSHAIAQSNMPDGSRADDAVAAVVGPPLDIESEYRMFVIDGEVVAASSYRHLQRPDFNAFVPHAAVELALTAASSWMPASAACIDVAVCADGTLGIVEANCINAARFYGANIAAVIEALSSYVERTWNGQTR
jgi:hypothetical protein